MLSDKAKYLAVIHLETEHCAMEKEGTVLLSGDKQGDMGLNSRMVFCMYRSIVRLMKYLHMSTVKRTAYIDASGALRTCPSAALNTLLNILPI